ncbi:MAG TPA: DUF222 domain-containing protein [Jatrophihabitantaceae bacterium]|nr:DUF222 domain-containing protein [Jatrophihabitantaceae bacterium]
MCELADAVAKRLASAVPDAAGVAELAAIEDGLSPDGAWEAVGALTRQIAWLEARKAKSLQLAQSYVPEVGRLDGRDWAQEELAGMLALSPTAAAVQLDTARRLPGRTRAMSLLEAGEITLAHVRALLDETLGVDAQRIAEIDDRVIAEAPGRTPSAFRRIVRRAVLAAMTRQEQSERISERVDERYVAVSYDPDGVMATLRAYLPAEHAARVMATLTGMARAGTDAGSDADDRTMQQKTADALVQLAAHADENGIQLATEQRLKPHVQVTVALSTLIGLDNQPAELDGFPIPAELGVRIAADPTGTWHRIVTDDVGQVVDYGRTTYRPPPDLADHVIARDRTCVWTGCNQPARRAEIDHRKRWRDFGLTDADNLQCLCVKHHHFKEAGWRSRLLPDGSIHWTSPRGRASVRAPATYPIDTTRAALAV